MRNHVSPFVIARSQRVGARRRPMTGSATKQSRVAHVALDCFAYARNDGDANLSHSSCPAKAGHPVTRVACCGRITRARGYWIVRSSRTMTAEWNVPASSRTSERQRALIRDP